MKIAGVVSVMDVETVTPPFSSGTFPSIRRSFMSKTARATASFLLSALLLLVSTAHLGAQTESAFAGHWEGAIVTPNGDLGINVDLKQGEDPAWTGDISIPAQMAEDVPLADVVVEGNTVSFRMADVPGDPTFKGTLSEDGKTITGPFTQGGAQLEFRLTRSDL